MNSRFSIITVCYNCEDLIEKTINSVLNQKYRNFEYILIDGGSTDDTCSIISRYQDQIDFFVSEKDAGIYDAMNKGLSNASGDIIYYLNCGDCFYDDLVLQKVAEGFSSNPDYDMLYGDVIKYQNHQTNLQRTYRKGKADIIARGINHQTIFTKKSVFADIGNFNLNYQIYADFDWLLRAVFLGEKRLLHLDMPVVYYLMGGKSAGNKYRKEREEIIDTYATGKELIEFAKSYPVTFLVHLKYYISRKLRIDD